MHVIQIMINMISVARGVARGSPGGFGTNPKFGPQTQKKLGPNRLLGPNSPETYGVGGIPSHSASHQPAAPVPVRPSPTPPASSTPRSVPPPAGRLTAIRAGAAPSPPLLLRLRARCRCRHRRPLPSSAPAPRVLPSGLPAVHAVPPSPPLHGSA